MFRLILSVSLFSLETTHTYLLTYFVPYYNTKLQSVKFPNVWFAKQISDPKLTEVRPINGLPKTNSPTKTGKEIVLKGYLTFILAPIAICGENTYIDRKKINVEFLNGIV